MYSRLHIPVVFVEMLTRIEIWKGNPASVKGAIRDKRTLCTWSLLLWNLASYSKVVDVRVCRYISLLSVFSNHTFSKFSSLFIDHSFCTYHFSNIHICNMTFELGFLSLLGGGTLLLKSIDHFVLYVFDNIIFSAAFLHTPQHIYVLFNEYNAVTSKKNSPVVYSTDRKR